MMDKNITLVEFTNTVLKIIADAQLAYSYKDVINILKTDNYPLPHNIKQVLNKLEEDGYIERTKAVEKIYLDVYTITWDGKRFIENGGYSEDLFFAKTIIHNVTITPKINESATTAIRRKWYNSIFSIEILWPILVTVLGGLLLYFLIKLF
jgi:DNA-binding PadR family transcriptional regulator